MRWRMALCLVLALCLAPPTEGRKKDKKKAHRGTHDAVPAATPAPKNLCDIREPGVTVYCHCNGVTEVDNATDATCWIFNGEKDANDPVWDYFATQRSLEILKLSPRPDGRLLAVPTRALSQLPNLKKIEVQYGALGQLPPFAFANITQLKEISLSRSQITSLSPKALYMLPQLEQLNMDDNRLSELRRDCLQLPQLQMLFLARNNLSLLHDRALSQLPRLEELELPKNQLSVLTRETFAGLKSLRRLDLQMNRLTVLGERTFAELPMLEDLELDENDIQMIDPRAFVGLVHLRRLSLSSNRLKELPPDVLIPVHRLRALDLRDNSLTSLSFGAARPMLPALRGSATADGIQHAALHLDGNNLQCDCRLSWMYTLHNETTNDQVRNALEELTCILAEPLPFLDGDSSLMADDLGTEEPDFVRDAPSLAGGNNDAEDEYDEGLRKHLFQIPANLLPCPEEHSGKKQESSRTNMVDYEFGLELNAKMAAGRATPTIAAAILCAAIAAFLALGT